MTILDVLERELLRLEKNPCQSLTLTKEIEVRTEEATWNKT